MGDSIRDAVTAASKKYNLDSRLVDSVVTQESSGNPNAWNKSGGGQGAAGLMGVRAPALSDYNAANGTQYQMKDLLNPAVGAEVGSWYLDQQLSRFKDPGKALVAYNQGPNSSAVNAGSNGYSQGVLKRVGYQTNQQPSSPQTQPQGNTVLNPFNNGQPNQPQASQPQNAQPTNAPSAGAGGDILAKFGYSSDGTPQASTPAKQPASQPAQTANAQASGAPVGNAGASVLAQFGYGADGTPQKQATQPATPNAQTAQPGVSQQNARGNISTGSVMALGESRTPVSNTPPPSPSDTGSMTRADADAAQKWNNQQKARAALQTVTGTPEDANNSFASGVVHGLDNALSGATQFAAHTAKTAANTFLSPDNALTRGANAWADAEDKNVAQSAQNAPQGFAGKAGTFVGEAIPGLLIPGGTATKAIVGGAMAGADAPVTQNAGDSYWSQKGVQAGIGAAGGGLIHGAGNLLTKAVTPSITDAAGVIRNSLMPGEKASMPSGTVPGVSPTLADNAGPGIRNLQQAASRANPAPFGARVAENAEARGTAASGLTGNASDLQTAINDRAAQSGPLYARANAETFTPDKTISDIMSRPSAQSAMTRAKTLAAESGQPLKAGVDYPAADGSGTYSGRALNFVKQSMDDAIGTAGVQGIGQNERAALVGTKNGLLNWMDSQSPTFANARGTYESLSKPVSQMQYLQGANLTDAQGNLTLAKVDNFIKATEKARKDPTSQASSLTNDQMQQLYGLRDSLRGEAMAAKPTGMTSGSATAQNQLQDKLFANQTQSGPGIVNSLIGSGLGGAAGHAVGGFFGAPGAGSAVGATVGGAISNWLAKNGAARAAATQGKAVSNLTNALLNPSPELIAAINKDPSKYAVYAQHFANLAKGVAPAAGGAASNVLLNGSNILR